MEGDRFGNWMTGDLSLGEVQIQYIYMNYTFGREFIAWISKSQCSSML